MEVEDFTKIGKAKLSTTEYRNCNNKFEWWNWFLKVVRINENSEFYFKSPIIYHNFMRIYNF